MKQIFSENILIVFNSFTRFYSDSLNKCKLLHSYRFRYTVFSVFNNLKQITNIIEVKMKTNMESIQILGPRVGIVSREN